MTTRHLLRTAAAALAAVAVMAPASALAMTPPDGFYDAGTPSGRWYGLFWNGAFVSEVHLKGCASELPVSQVRQPDGSYKATVTGSAKGAPCVVDAGLNITPAFRAAIATALKGSPVATSFAIVEVGADGKPATEIAGTGYISDVTVGAAPYGDARGLLEVELVPRSGTLRKQPATARTLGAAGIDEIDLAQTALTFDGKALGTGATIRPLVFKRADASSGPSATTVPADLDLAAPVVGVPAASPATASVDSWHASSLTGSIAYKPLVAVYRTAAARTFTIGLDTVPVSWSPYAAGGTRQLELGAGATPLEVS
jgi:hypothetical protein